MFYTHKNKPWEFFEWTQNQCMKNLMNFLSLSLQKTLQMMKMDFGRNSTIPGQMMKVCTVKKAFWNTSINFSIIFAMQTTKKKKRQQWRKLCWTLPTSKSGELTVFKLKILSLNRQSFNVIITQSQICNPLKTIFDEISNYCDSIITEISENSLPQKLFRQEFQLANNAWRLQSFSLTKTSRKP